MSIQACKFYFVCGLLIGTFSACGPKYSEHKPPRETEKSSQKKKSDQRKVSNPSLKPSQESIQIQLVEKSCVSCHESATSKNRHVDLRDIGKIIEGEHNHATDSDHSRTALVKPGCPKQSFFLSIMREGKMPPPPAPSIESKSLNIVEIWIKGLKDVENCEPDEPGDDEIGDDEPGA